MVFLTKMGKANKAYIKALREFQESQHMDANEIKTQWEKTLTEVIFFDVLITTRSNIVKHVQGESNG